MAEKSTQERAKWEIQTLDTDIVFDMLTCTLPSSWLAQTLRDELAARGVESSRRVVRVHEGPRALARRGAGRSSAGPGLDEGDLVTDSRACPDCAGG